MVDAAPFEASRLPLARRSAQRSFNVLRCRPSGLTSKLSGARRRIRRSVDAQSTTAGVCPLERRVRTLLVTGHRSNPHGRLHSATIQRQRRAPMREHAIDEKRSSNGRKASAVHIDSDQTLDLPMAVDDARIQAPGLPRPCGYHDLHLLGSTLSSNVQAKRRTPAHQTLGGCTINRRPPVFVRLSDGMDSP